ncbi:MAG: choice-of-anchor V domain-containing protein, partial [Bryobacteraceae bacterium]
MSLLTLTAFLPVALFGHSAGADPGFSGAPGDSTCVACHGGTPNTGSGSVAINFPQGSYTPGATYKVTVTVADPTALRWGFEITARTSANLQAGTFAPVDALTQAISDSSLLYETHTSTGTRRGTPVSAAFDLNWTAPATAVGDVTFYAAGNAANNNGGPDPGDKIYMTQLAVPASSSPVNTPTMRADQPVLQSFSELPKMSPGTWIELYGTNLSATTRQWQDSDFQGNTAPTQLDGVGVLIDDVPAFVYYISNTQINVQVPNINTTGDSTIVITGPGGVRSAPITMADKPACSTSRIV